MKCCVVIIIIVSAIVFIIAIGFLISLGKGSTNNEKVMEDNNVSIGGENQVFNGSRVKISLTKPLNDKTKQMINIENKVVHLCQDSSDSFRILKLDDRSTNFSLKYRDPFFLSRRNEYFSACNTRSDYKSVITTGPRADSETILFVASCEGKSESDAIEYGDKMVLKGSVSRDINGFNKTFTRDDIISDCKSLVVYNTKGTPDLYGIFTLDNGSLCDINNAELRFTK